MVLGFASFALFSSHCKKKNVAWNTEPSSLLDAGALDASLPDGAALLDGGHPTKVDMKDVAMGTSVTFIAFTNEKVDEAKARELFTQALGEIKRLEGLLSEWKDDSDVGRLNKAEGEWTEVSPETLEVIEKGVLAGRQSDGTFDITFQVMSDLWKFGDARDSNPTVPKKDAVQAKKKHVDYRKVEIDGQKVRLAKGQKMGLGGIAKGYIVDKAARILKDGGLTSFLVQAGGDLYGAGKKPDGSAWV
ncbi:MAG TPA: FAD:protein FMN transferase, partial [Polyangiaceae bacterium]